jgi:D-aminoacyl-tRNA deacylase
VIALIQRVAEASVTVDGETVAAIGAGLLALVAVERGDAEGEATRLADRVLGYRIFPDAQAKMNLSLAEAGGALLAVPQFTLAADTKSGARPGFSAAAAPAEGERLFRRFLGRSRAKGIRVESGRFGAHMKVHLVNDGPVTFWLQVPPVHRPGDVR